MNERQRKTILVGREAIGLWSLYFLAKLYLHFRGSLNISVAWNLAFMAWLAATPREGGAKRALDVLLAFLLLWRDSWFPPLYDALEFWINPDTRPSLGFAADFALSYISLPQIAAMLAVGGAAMVLRRARVRLAPVVVILLCLAGFGNLSRADAVPEQSGDAIESFHADEAGRRVAFPSRPGAAFDIVFLHVCSFSWDDLQVVGRQDDAFFSRFDYVLDNFNTVTAYSGPSAIRLHRAACGQSSNGALYNEAPDDCYLMDRLRGAGYTVYSAMDHDGTYGGWEHNTVQLGRGAVPLRPEGLPVEQVNFDGSPMYSPDAVFDRWMERRDADRPERAVLYMNTIVLHTGAHWKGETRWWENRDKNALYAERLDRVFRFTENVKRKLAARGRDALLVFVPEHGAGLRATKIQNAGLRDLPLPRITKAPVALDFIGPSFRAAPSPARRTDLPVSFLALARALALGVGDPVKAATDLKLDALPRTPFVAEDRRARVIQREGKFLLQTKGGTWIPLAVEDLAPADRALVESDPDS